MNTATITATTVELSAITVKDQAAAALFELTIHSELLTDESQLLWLKLPNGKGLGVQGFGAAIQVIPGYFQGDSLLTYGMSGSEFIRISQEDAEKAIARAIRRANKLEIAV